MNKLDKDLRHAKKTLKEKFKLLEGQFSIRGEFLTVNSNNDAQLSAIADFLEENGASYNLGLREGEECKGCIVVESWEIETSDKDYDKIGLEAFKEDDDDDICYGADGYDWGKMTVAGYESYDNYDG